VGLLRQMGKVGQNLCLQRFLIAESKSPRKVLVDRFLPPPEAAQSQKEG
jgi:hypothetical protein